MGDEVRRILRAAMQLSAEEQLEIAAVLTDRVGEGRAIADIDAAWATEIERRLQAVRDGRMVLIPAEEVDREIDEVLARARRAAI
ncbi:addiction module protein [Nannocystaceae bacterium ST9]